MFKLLCLSTIPPAVLVVIFCVGVGYGVSMDMDAAAMVNQMIMIGIILYVVAFVITYRNANKITKVITGVQAGIEGIAAGDLNTKLDENLMDRVDELGDMARATDELRAKLVDVIGTIQEDAATLLDSGYKLDEMADSSSKTADGINCAVEDISRGSVSQAEDIEATNVRVEEMGKLIERIVSEVENLQQTARSMNEAGSESAQIMRELSVTNDETVAAIGRVSDNVRTTDESVQRISEAVNLITAIADQTNLLSLNASIEAARAGEAGKGFAVVATEIQKLSVESNESASHIQEAIAKLSQDSAKSMGEMDSLHAKLDEQQTKLQETMDKFHTVSAGIDASKAGTDEISVQAQNCDDARGSMVDLVANLSAVSQENAANSEETTASMQELSATIQLLAEAAQQLKDVAENMSASTQYFKL